MTDDIRTETVLAIDGGGTTLRVAAVGGAGNDLVATRTPTPETTDGLVAAIVAAADAAEGVAAVGIGVAGFVDAPSGRLLWSPHVPGGPVDIAAPVEAATRVPVIVDNDANMATLAEARLGAGAGHRMVLGMTIGTGIGAGLVVDGSVERGRGLLGEVGHITFGGDLPCGCGRSGCWETVASGRALDGRARRLAESDPRGAFAARVAGREPSGVDLVQAATEGDEEAGREFDAVARAIGRGLADLISIFDPDVIVLGGGVGSLGAPLLDRVRPEITAALVGSEHRRPTPVKTAQFGQDAGLVGAALAARGAL